MWRTDYPSSGKIIESVWVSQTERDWWPLFLKSLPSLVSVSLRVCNRSFRSPSGALWLCGGHHTFCANAFRNRGRNSFIVYQGRSPSYRCSFWVINIVTESEQRRQVSGRGWGGAWAEQDILRDQCPRSPWRPTSPVPAPATGCARIWWSAGSQNASPPVASISKYPQSSTGRTVCSSEKAIWNY